ncbi:hypothetical protein RI129_010184 [Pyrocoelia pectoralis]|uniref:Uncharacterized protein n=1 Tax=Pyrocoelia pectoralis TaxID=417401 RepID=A0AAN7V680_9COLE
MDKEGSEDPKQTAKEETCFEEVEGLCNKANRTEFDAVHPRFSGPKDPQLIREFQVANDYYCEQCRLFFAPTVLALQTHFKEDMVQHQPLGNCFYCNGPVYAYSFNNRRRIHHSCGDRPKM